MARLGYFPEINDRFMSIINFVKEYKWDNIKECWIKNAF